MWFNHTREYDVDAHVQSIINHHAKHACNLWLIGHHMDVIHGEESCMSQRLLPTFRQSFK